MLSLHGWLMFNTCSDSRHIEPDAPTPANYNHRGRCVWGMQQIPTRSNTHAQAANAIAELFCLSVNKLQVFKAFVQFFLGRKICSNSRNLIHGVGLGLLQLLLYTTCVYNVKSAGELMLLICCNFVGKLIVCGTSPHCLCICACVCLCVCELMDELAVW